MENHFIFGKIFGQKWTTQEFFGGELGHNAEKITKIQVNWPTQYKLLQKQAKRRHFETMTKNLIFHHIMHIYVGRSAWEHDRENWVLYSHKEWTHSSNCTFLSSSRCLATSSPFIGHNIVSILHSAAHEGTWVNINLGCVSTQDTLCPGWAVGLREQGSHLVGCMPQQMTELARIVS